jgi:hypothetical protein
MITKDIILEIIASQRVSLTLPADTVIREVLTLINYKANHAKIITGIRRCGKSTLLKQIIAREEKAAYLNFEDTRLLALDAGDWDRIYQALTESSGIDSSMFFDEIQNTERWEVFVRRLLDEGKNVFITGSNASLLSRELGTRLTGRHLRTEMLPFSYLEFLSFTNSDAGPGSFDDFFHKGGFPEFLRNPDPAIHQELFNDIIIRDVVVRHRLKSDKIIRTMAQYLLSNVAREFSYSKLKVLFGLGSVNTVISSLNWLEDSYVLFQVPMFDFSLKKQIINPKKIYGIDQGFVCSNFSSHTADNGRLLENIVFLELMRRRQKCFYFRRKNECDFITTAANKFSGAYQVVWEITADNLDREIAGIAAAMNEFQIPRALILTHHQEDEFEVNGKKIKAVPVWKWMIENV